MLLITIYQISTDWYSCNRVASGGLESAAPGYGCTAWPNSTEQVLTALNTVFSSFPPGAVRQEKDHRITESLRLTKTSKIIKLHPHPSPPWPLIMSPGITSPRFLYSSRNGDSTTPRAAVPLHLCSLEEDIFPNIQLESPHHNITSCPGSIGRH